MRSDTPLLIIGAGPFGLAVAASARAHGADYVMVGEPMAFWRCNMPKGMLLRSTCDWHLDPDGIATIDAYLSTISQSCGRVEPLSLDFYLAYTEWFMRQTAIRATPGVVSRLDRNHGQFVATLANGESVTAQNVVVAVGLRYFAHLPAEIVAVLPPGSFAHTCELVELAALRERRCLILGGRQSAFEWAALLGETGAHAIHVCYRHATPRFEISDWSWVAALAERTRSDGSWYRRLTDHEQQAIADHMWLEGRAKLEPWLKPRITNDAIQLWPNTRVSACVRSAAGELSVHLDNGHTLIVDQIILATGYKVDISRVPFLREGNLWPGLKVRDGFPELDAFFQTSHRGLFMTGQAAVQDFGPFFGFTVAVGASAARIGQALFG